MSLPPSPIEIAPTAGSSVIVQRLPMKLAAVLEKHWLFVYCGVYCTESMLPPFPLYTVTSEKRKVYIRHREHYQYLRS